jgi:hypothetical protein
LIAVSLASEPELLKKTRAIGTGSASMSRWASAMAVSLALPPN